MSDWENNPEGTTLAWLRAAVPSIDRVVAEAMAVLPARPMMLFALGDLSERELWAVAYAYNNLMTLYDRGTARRMPADRFVRASTMAPGAANAACTLHTASYVAEATRQRFVAWTNSWTLTQDTASAYVPHDPALRAFMRVFEAYVQFGRTLRLGEVVGVDKDEVIVVRRRFASVAQYQRYVDAYDRALCARQHACRRRLGCAQCCPSIATAVLSLYPRDVRFALPYVWEDDEKIVPEWFEERTAIITPYLHHRRLERVQNAVLWFFSGVPDPLGTFFRVAQGLVGPTCDDVGRAVGIVQETAVRAFIMLWDTPKTAKQRQEQFVRPALLAGRLFDPFTDSLVEPL
jgi:hypothetical protein